MFKQDCFYYGEIHYPTLKQTYERAFHCDVYGELDLDLFPNSKCNDCKHYLKKDTLKKKSNKYGGVD